METILSNCSANISELKRNPSALIRQADGEPIVILNHNKPTAYLVPAKTFEMIMEMLEEIELGRIIKKRQNEKKSAIEISIDEL